MLVGGCFGWDEDDLTTIVGILTWTACIVLLSGSRVIGSHVGYTLEVADSCTALIIEVCDEDRMSIPHQ